MTATEDHQPVVKAVRESASPERLRGLLASSLGLWSILGLVFAVASAFVPDSAIKDEYKLIFALITVSLGVQMQILEAFNRNAESSRRGHARLLESQEKAAVDNLHRDDQLLKAVREQTESVTNFGRIWNALIEGPLQENEFQKLCENAAAVDLSTKPVWVKEWADDRVAELADLFEELTHSRVVLHEAADFDRYLIDHLVPETQGSIDATSLQSLDDDFWTSIPGRRYLAQLKDAIARGVRVRRIFIYDEWDDALQDVAMQQQQMGVLVRRVRRADIPDPRLRRDFIVFRDVWHESETGRVVNFAHERGAIYEIRTMHGGDITGCTITCNAPGAWGEQCLDTCEQFDDCWLNLAEDLPLIPAQAEPEAARLADV